MHNLIQRPGELYTRRRREPSAIDEALRLFLLDLQLLQAQPQVGTYDQTANGTSSPSPVWRLLRLYLTGGRVAGAATIAEIAERFGVGALPDGTAARARAAALAAGARRDPALADAIAIESFIEYAFLRWILTPAATAAFVNRVYAQAPWKGTTTASTTKSAAPSSLSPSNSTATRCTSPAPRSPMTECARTTSLPRAVLPGLPSPPTLSGTSHERGSGRRHPALGPYECRDR